MGIGLMYQFFCKKKGENVTLDYCNENYLFDTVLKKTESDCCECPQGKALRARLGRGVVMGSVGKTFKRLKAK